MNIKDRKDFIKLLDPEHFQGEYEEVIDGVRVVHTGKMIQYSDRRNNKGEYEEDIDGVRVVHKGKMRYFNNRYDEILEMYDANGNLLYDNCSSREEAEKLIEKLKAEGKEAVIGPKAPIKVYGKPSRNPNEDDVGVYIVDEKSNYNLKHEHKMIQEEILEMYDANGNRFYSNCSSREEAEKMIEKLKAEGKEAVIGPKAPIRDYEGKLKRNTNEGYVGVYIIKEKEEKEESRENETEEELER